MSRVLVTGGGGFVGQWLARALIERGDDIVLTGLGPRPTEPVILTETEWRGVRWQPMDIRLADDVAAAVDVSRPDMVVHLAGISFPPDGERDASATFDVNTVGAARLLDALGTGRARGVIDPVIVVVGSGLQYGTHDPAEMPLTESAEQRPITRYAASKAAQEIAAFQAFRGVGLRVVCTRSFNHSGPGHAAQFLLPSLVDRVVRMGRGDGAATLRVGNDVVRDYLHVADVVRAYLLLAERGIPGEAYNVCSGVGVSARRLAADILLRAGTAAEISTDPALVREADIPVLVGSPERLMRTTGWTMTRTTADIIDDLLHAATH